MSKLHMIFFITNQFHAMLKTVLNRTMRVYLCAYIINTYERKHLTTYITPSLLPTISY